MPHQVPRVTGLAVQVLDDLDGVDGAPVPRSCPASVSISDGSGSDTGRPDPPQRRTATPAGRHTLNFPETPLSGLDAGCLAHLRKNLKRRRALASEARDVPRVEVRAAVQTDEPSLQILGSRQLHGSIVASDQSLGPTRIGAEVAIGRCAAPSIMPAWPPPTPPTSSSSPNPAWSKTPCADTSRRAGARDWTSPP